MDGRDNLAGSGPSQIKLRILATTDVHGTIWPHDYSCEKAQPGRGLAAAFTRISQLRAEAPLTLLFDNGDAFQGTPLADLLASDRSPERNASHPLVEVMNRFGYDGAAIGNHDLNYGLDYLFDAISGANFPFLSANLLRRGEEGARHVLQPWTIIERTVPDDGGAEHKLRIGLIGFVPPPSADWDRHVLGPDITSEDILESAALHLPHLLAEKPDLVIALCHSGIGETGAQPRMEHAVVPLAALEGIDMVIAGHSHRLFPGPAFAKTAQIDPQRGLIHGKPVVEPGAYGEHIGLADLTLDWRDGQCRIAEIEVRVEKAAQRVDLATERLLQPLDPFHQRVQRRGRHHLGELKGALDTSFALIGADPVGQFTGDVLSAYARRVLGPQDGRVVICATAPFKTGGRGGPTNFLDIRPGPVERRHIPEIYPFPNSICLIEALGADLWGWLENSARIFNEIQPGRQNQALIDPELPGYFFDTLWGLRYDIDLTVPAGAGRIRELRYKDGSPVDAEDELVIATNSHRAAGGGFETAVPPRVFHLGPRPIQQVIADHIRDAGAVAPSSHPIWSFCPCAGATAWFPAAPGAEARIADVSDRNLADGGMDGSGFRRILLTL